MGFFVEECRGCRKRWTSFDIDPFMLRSFRRSEEGKAVPSAACQDWMAEYYQTCPEYIAYENRKRAEREAKKEAKEAEEAALDGKKASKKPTSTILAKKSWDAVEKPRTTKKKVDTKALQRVALADIGHRMASLADKAEHEWGISEPIDQDPVLAEAIAGLQPIWDGIESRQAGRDEEMTVPREQDGGVDAPEASPRLLSTPSSSDEPPAAASANLPAEIDRLGSGEETLLNTAEDAPRCQEGGSHEPEAAENTTSGVATGGSELAEVGSGHSGQDGSDTVSDSASSVPAPAKPAPTGIYGLFKKFGGFLGFYSPSKLPSICLTCEYVRLIAGGVLEMLRL